MITIKIWLQIWIFWLQIRITWLQIWIYWLYIRIYWWQIRTNWLQISRIYWSQLEYIEVIDKNTLIPIDIDKYIDYKKRID